MRAVEEPRTLADGVADGVEESARTAGAAAELGVSVRSAAREGVTAASGATAAMGSVRDTSESAAGAMQALAAKSGEIGSIVETITAIAEQTNLLALNAAIEPARDLAQLVGRFSL